MQIILVTVLYCCVQGSRRLTHILLLGSRPQVSSILADWSSLQDQPNLKSESVYGLYLNSALRYLLTEHSAELNDIL